MRTTSGMSCCSVVVFLSAWGQWDNGGGDGATAAPYVGRRGLSSWAPESGWCAGEDGLPGMVDLFKFPVAKHKLTG